MADIVKGYDTFASVPNSIHPQWLLENLPRLNLFIN